MKRLRVKIPQSNGRWARWGRRVSDGVPLTVRGAVVAGLAALALWPFGLGNLDLVLFVFGIVGLVLVALAAVLVVATTLWVRRRLDAGATEPLRLEAGSPIRTGFRAPGLRAVPLVEMRWVWLDPRQVAMRLRRTGKIRTEEVVATRRGERSHIVRRFTAFDVFGLSQMSWQRTESVPVTVLPSVGRLRSMPVVQSLSATEGLPHPSGAPEGDRMEIRRYVPGDSPRHILWKTYARTRELNVRLPERSVDRAERTVAYLVTGTGDEPAAAAARVAIETGALGERWVFGADGNTEPVTTLDEAIQVIARSGDVAPGDTEAAGLGHFLDRLTRDDGGRSPHCVVFAPALHGPWIETALTAGARAGGALSFVLATDGVARPRARGWWRRILYVPRDERGTASTALAAAVRALAVSGSPTLVVDRATGQVFGEAHQRQLGMAS